MKSHLSAYFVVNMYSSFSIPWFQISAHFDLNQMILADIMADIVDMADINDIDVRY